MSRKPKTKNVADSIRKLGYMYTRDAPHQIGIRACIGCKYYCLTCLEIPCNTCKIRIPSNFVPLP
jgi:hypothetical protein